MEVQPKDSNTDGSWALYFQILERELIFTKKTLLKGTHEVQPAFKYCPRAAALPALPLLPETSSCPHLSLFWPPHHHGAHVPRFRNQQDKAIGESSMIQLSLIIVITNLLLLVRAVDRGLESIHRASISPLQRYVSPLKASACSRCWSHCSRQHSSLSLPL